MQKSEKEVVCSASGQVDSTVDDVSLGELKKFQRALIVPPETVEYPSKTKNSQAADDAGAEAKNTVIKVNVETPEGEHFLGLPSAVPVSVEDTCKALKNSEPKQETLQAGNEMSESDKQVEATGETETEENKAIEESAEKPEKSNMSHDIGNLTGTSLLMTETEESNCMIKEESLKEESIIENKEAEKSINLMDEVPEATKPSEREANEDEKEKSIHGDTEETFTSTTDIRSDEEATLKIREEAGYEADEKLQKDSGISYDEKSQDTIEPSTKIKCMTPIEDERKHKNGMDTESLKVVAKIWSDVIIKESPDEFEEQIEMSEKTAESDSTSDEPGKENESPEQKGDDSFMKHMGTLSANDLLPSKEASSGENRYEEESSVSATNNIAETEIIDAFEHKQSGTSSNKERRENLLQNEAGKEKLEGSSNVISEDFKVAAETITSVKEVTPIKIREKSFGEETKKDLPKHTESNEPLIESKEKKECGEIVVPNKNVNDLHVTHALVEEARQNEGKPLDEVFNSEPEGKIQEAYEANTEVEKQIDDAPEACANANATILEQTSIEEAETAELIPKASETDEEKLREASGPDFEEKSVMLDDRESTDQKMQKNEEACDTATEEILANSTDAGKCVTDAEASDEVNNAAAREEKIEQSIQVESPPEAAPELAGQDERCKEEDNYNRTNITNEEEHDGTKVAATVVVINEQVIEDNGTQISSESIDKQNVESRESNKSMPENSEGDYNREQVPEESNIRCILPESLEQVPINDLKYEENEAEMSKEEILENSDTAEAAQSCTQETIKATESPNDILEGSTVKQGELHSEERNLTPIETSSEEKRNEGTSPVIAIEENGGDSEPAASEDNMETKTAESEEDLKHILQRKSGEDLPSSLSMSSDKEEVFNSDADKTPGDVEEGPTQNLEEALQKEESEKDTELKTDTNCKTSIEETSRAELYQDSNDGGKDEETEKHNIKEECATTNILLEPIREKSLQSSKEEKVDQSIELEEEKIKQSSQVDESKQGNDTHISPVLIEQETLENCEGNKKKAEYTEGEHDREQMVEETNSRGLVAELVELKNLADDKMKENKSTGEITKNSKTSEVAESGTHETSTTIGSITEILDTTLVKQRESLEFSAQRSNNDGCLVILAEKNSDDNVSPGSKDNIEKEPSIGEEDLQHTVLIKEPEEKYERSISAMSNENEAFSSNADKTPCLKEEGISQDFDEALQKEDNDKGTEAKNDTKENNIEAVENLEIVTESSDASKIKDEGMVLEPELEEDRMLAQDEIKKDESEELYEDSEKHNTLEQCSTANILLEPTEEKTQQSFEEDEREDETPKAEVCVEVETTSLREDAAEKQNEEGTSQDVDEAPQKKDNDKETEGKNDTPGNKIAIEENLEIVAESSDASKIKDEGMVLEVELEEDRILAQDEIKKDESEELYEDSKNADESESEKHNTLEECSTANILLEPNEEKTQQSFEEGKADETPKTEVCLEIETTSVREDAAEKQNEEGTSQDLDEAPQKEDNEKETEEKNDTQDNKIAMGKSIDKVAESSAASKGTQSEKNKVLAQDEIKNKESIELYGDSKNANKSKSEKHNTLEDCSTTNILVEPTEYKTHPNCVKEGNEEEALKTKACLEPETTIVEDAAEKQIAGGENTLELSGELEVEKVDKSSEENDTTAKTFKEEECEITQIANNDDKGRRNIEKGGAEENMFELLARAADNEDSLVKKNVEKEHDKQVDDSNSFTEETEATNLAEEPVPEILKERAESNVNSCPLDVMKESEAETPTIETGGGLIEESVTLSHMSIKETEKEIKEKEETAINDSDSASITPVTEGKGLQEAEPENKRQIARICPAFEEEGVAEIEAKETTLESVDVSVKPKDTFDSGEKRDNEIPTVVDKDGEKNEGPIEESAMVSDTPNKETEEEITEKGEITIEDSDSAPIIVVTEAKGLKEFEPEDKAPVESVGPAFEEKGIAEIETKVTIPENVDNNVEPEVTPDLGAKRDNEIPTVAAAAAETNECLIEESVVVSHASNNETEEEITGKEETCIKDSDSASVTVVTEVKGQQQAESEDKKQLEIVGPAFEEKDLTEIETKRTTGESVDINVRTTDTIYLSTKRNDENSRVADKGGKTNGGLKAEYATVSRASNEEPEEELQQKGEISIDDSDSASIIVVTEEKRLQEAEPDDKKQVENVVPAAQEKCEDEFEAKETTLEIVDISVKPEDTTDLDKRDNENSTAAGNEIPTVTDIVGETNEGLIEEYDIVSNMQDKKTEEEIKEKEETTIDDSDSDSITVVTKAKGPQKVEPEDKKQVESVDPTFEEKGIAETETKERTLERVDINVKAEDTSDLGEKRDKEIPNMADEPRETIECITKNFVPDAGSEDQTVVTTTDKSLEEILKDAKLMTTDMSERIDETPAQDQGPFENAETTCVSKAIDEMSMDKQGSTTNPVNVSELKSIDAVKETANEEVQKQKVEPENAENLSKSEDVEISKGEETGKLADQESEKTILEGEISAGNLKEIEVESAGVEPEGEAHYQRHEDVNNTDDGTATEEKLECTCEAVAENQTSEMLPESDKSQMEENSCENQNQERDKEIKEKGESQLEPEEHEEQNANETTNAVVLTEKEREEVEQSADSEDIKELAVEEERGINELHASSTLDKTTNEIEISAPVSSEYDKAVDLKEQMEVENSEIKEDSTRETQASLARESEEQKSQDINIEPDLKESKEKIGDIVEESLDRSNKIVNAILTAKTETSSLEAGLGDKLEKDFHVEAAEAEKSLQVKEVDNVKLEETFELAAELALNDNGHAPKESIIEENKDVNEPEETKIASETVSQSKDVAAEEDIAGKTQTMEKPDKIPTHNDDKAERENAAMENSGADEDEETKIISNAVDVNKDLSAEETAEAVKGPTAENIDQIPTSDYERTQTESVAAENPKANEVNKIKLVPNAVYKSNNRENEESSGKISTVEKRYVGEPEETKTDSEAVFESKVQEAGETEVGKTQNMEMPDQKSTNNDDNTEGGNAAMENSGADEVETEIVADEIKVVSDTIYEPKGQGAEETEVGESQITENTDQVPTDDDDLVEKKNEAMENSGADEVEQIKTVSDAFGEAKDQGTEETAETGKSPTVEKRDQAPTSNCDHAQKESVGMENPKADEVNDIKVVSDATCESNNQVTEEYAEKIPTVEKLDQTPATNSQQVEEDRVITQYQDVEEVKDQITEDIDENGKNSTKHNPDANKIEEANKAASDMELVTEYRVTADQTPSEEKLNVQLPCPTSTFPLKDEIIATVKKIEEEKPQVEKLGDEVLEDSSATKQTEETCLQTGFKEPEVPALGFNTNKAEQDSSTKVHKEENQNPDETIATVEKMEEEKTQLEKLKDEALKDSSAAKPTEETCLQTGSTEVDVSTQGFNIDKDVQDSSTKVYKEEDQNPDEALKLKPQKNENKVKCADSSSATDQSKANTDLTGPTEKDFILDSETETSDKALQSDAIIPSHEKPSESEDTEIKYKHLEVISDVGTEEVQIKTTSESIEIPEKEVSKEEILEEKEVAESCQAIALSEETLNKSLQGDDGLKQEERKGDETNDPFKTTVDGIQYDEPSVETEESTASTNMREQVTTEDTRVDDSDQLSVENKTIKERFPCEFEGKNVDDLAIKFGSETVGEESKLGSGKTEATAPGDEESSMEISKKESIQQFAKEGELIQETQKSKESCCVKNKMQIPTQAELIERPDTIGQTDNEYDPPVWLEGITESPQKAEAGDLNPGNATGVHSKAEVKPAGEQRTDCSMEETNEGTLMVDSNKALLSDLFQRSRKETTQVAKHVNKETESTATTEENQTVKPETVQVKEAKVDKEKEKDDGDEHNRTASSASDAAVTVKASKDMDVKSAHKKSHNILSGVGSKVKHSISKVKKVITGKSSHSK